MTHKTSGGSPCSFEASCGPVDLSTSGPQYLAGVSSSSQPDKGDQALCSDRHFHVADAVGPERRCRLSGSVNTLMKQEDLKAEPRSGKSIPVHI